MTIIPAMAAHRARSFLGRVASGGDGGQQAPELTAGEITVTPGDQQNSLSATAAEGGTGDKTYQWYASMTQGFTPGAGNELSGFTSLSETHTGLTNDDTWYYRLIATDEADETVTYAEKSGTPSEVTSIFFDDFSTGDTSKTGGGFSWNNSSYDVVEYDTGLFALEHKYNPASTRQLAAAASVNDDSIVVGSDPNRSARFILDPGGPNEETHFVLNESTGSITDNGDGTFTVLIGEFNSGPATTIQNNHSSGADYQYNRSSNSNGDWNEELRFSYTETDEIWFRYRTKYPANYIHRNPSGARNNKFFQLFNNAQNMMTVETLNGAAADESHLRRFLSDSQKADGSNNWPTGTGGANDFIGPGNNLPLDDWGWVGMYYRAASDAEVVDGRMEVWADNGSGVLVLKNGLDWATWDVAHAGLVDGGYHPGWANSGYLDQTDILVTDWEVWTSAPDWWSAS